jgi:hypothetical protein
MAEPAGNSSKQAGKKLYLRALSQAISASMTGLGG